MKSTHINYIKQKIATGDIDHAILSLLEYSSDDPGLHKKASILSGRYQHWKKEKILIGENDPAEVNRIQAAILDLIEPEHQVNLSAHGNKFSNVNKVVVGLGLLLSLITVFWLLSESLIPSVSDLTLGNTKTFTMTLFIHGAKGPSDVVNYGRARVFLGGKDLGIQKITEEGKLTYEDIPTSYLNEKLTLDFLDNAYEIIKQAAETPSQSKRIEFIVKLKETEIRGTVFDPNNQVVPNAILDFDSGMAIDTTDENGNFNLTLIKGEGETTRLRVHYEEKVRYNQKLTVSNKVPFMIKLSSEKVYFP